MTAPLTGKHLSLGCRVSHGRAFETHGKREGVAVMVFKGGIHWSAISIGFLLASQLAAAADSGRSIESSDQRVIVRDGVVKLQSDLSATDIVTGIIPPPTSSDSGTLTVGRTSLPCGVGGTQVISGFIGSLTGSYSPTGLTGGDTVAGIFDNNELPPCLLNQALLSVSGFSSNPGKNWLTSITCNGVKNTASNGSFAYTSSNATATWSWSTQFGLLTLSVGSTVSCTIVHN